MTIFSSMGAFAGSVAAIANFGDPGLLVAGGLVVGTYVGVRAIFRRFIRKRFGKLRGLMEELEKLAATQS